MIPVVHDAAPVDAAVTADASVRAARDAGVRVVTARPDAAPPPRDAAIAVVAPDAAAPAGTGIVNIRFKPGLYANISIDGISLAPTFLGQPAGQQAHKFMVWEFAGYGGQQAVLLDDWKGVRRDIHEGKGSIELYAIREDPGERHDVRPNLHVEVQFVLGIEPGGRKTLHHRMGRLQPLDQQVGPPLMAHRGDAHQLAPRIGRGVAIAVGGAMQNHRRHARGAERHHRLLARRTVPAAELRLRREQQSERQVLDHIRATARRSAGPATRRSPRPRDTAC